MHTIPTRYKGYHFRSRLEARWAVFFNTLGIEWEYEKEGYDLGEAGMYLPDFWLPVCEAFIEVKGSTPTDDEYEKCQALQDLTQKHVFCVGSIPDVGMSYGPYWPSWIDPVLVPISLPSNYMRNMFEGESMYANKDDWGIQLCCPICGYNYVHIGKCTHKTEEHRSWFGRGDAIYMSMWCEAGHHWDLRYGFHKGGTWFDVETPYEERHCLALWLAMGDSAKRDAAIEAARSARFEHGERGAT